MLLKSLGKSNCLTYIPEDINLDLDPLNATVAGSPTISNGVVSGFSASNYLTLPEAFNPLSTPWEEVVCFTTGSDLTTEQTICCNNVPYWGYGVTVVKGKIQIGLTDSTSSFAMANNQTITASANTKYYVKMVFNGSNYTSMYSTDGVTWLNIFSLDSTKTIVGNTRIMGINDNKKYPFKGSIDLSQSYIKVNGSVWWQGGTGNLTLKAGSKVYVPNGFEEDGTTPKFDDFVIENDVNSSSRYSTLSNGEYLVQYYTTTKAVALFSTSETTSGTNIPTSSDTTKTLLFYNTGINKIEGYRNGADVTGLHSFPVGIVTINNSILTSLNQTFNGFGYIGSTVFVLPGVKALIPDGFNTNGTYKNIEYTVNNVLLGYNFDTSWTRDKQPLFISKNELITTGTANNNYYTGTDRSLYDNTTYVRFYDTSKNLMYKSGATAGVWEQESVAFLGYANVSSGIVSSLNINPVQTKTDYKPHILTYKKKLYYKYQDFVQPKLTSNGDMDGDSFAVNQSSVLNTVEGDGAWLAFDGMGSTTRWHSAQNLPQSIAWYNPNPLKITNVKVTNRSTDGSYPNAYQLQYSDDKINWTTTNSGNGTSGDSVSWGISVTESNAHKYWRLYITSASGSNNTYVAIGEIEITAQEAVSVESTSSDYDYWEWSDTKRYLFARSKRKYYKYNYTNWTQPVLTSNTSYGTLTGSGYYSSGADRNYWHISDGVIPTSNDGNDCWGTNNSATGWVNWELPEEIVITGIKIYNRYHTSTADYNLTGARFYTDSSKTTPIGEEFSITTSGGSYTLTGIPKEGIKTKNIYFYKTGATYSGIGELVITAQKVTSIESTVDDYDYYEYEDIKFY